MEGRLFSLIGLPHLDSDTRRYFRRRPAHALASAEDCREQFRDIAGRPQPMESGRPLVPAVLTGGGLFLVGVRVRALNGIRDYQPVFSGVWRSDRRAA